LQQHRALITSLCSDELFHIEIQRCWFAVGFVLPNFHNTWKYQ